MNSRGTRTIVVKLVGSMCLLAVMVYSDALLSQESEAPEEENEAQVEDRTGFALSGGYWYAGIGASAMHMFKSNGTYWALYFGAGYFPGFSLTGDDLTEGGGVSGGAFVCFGDGEGFLLDANIGLAGYQAIVVTQNSTWEGTTVDTDSQAFYGLTIGAGWLFRGETGLFGVIQAGVTILGGSAKDVFGEAIPTMNGGIGWFL